MTFDADGGERREADSSPAPQRSMHSISETGSRSIRRRKVESNLPKLGQLNYSVLTNLQINLTNFSTKKVMKWIGMKLRSCKL